MGDSFFTRFNIVNIDFVNERLLHLCLNGGHDLVDLL